MKPLFSLLAIGLLAAGCAGSKNTNSADAGADKAKGGWVRIFDGKTLNGWKPAETPSTFSVQDGALVVYGERAHLFYEGPVANHDFKNFEWKATIKTAPGANSGMFIHTQYQERGWPNVGHEIQVNQTHEDWRKTGSVYAFQDVRDVFVKDNEWYTQHIIVKDNKVTIKVNDQIINEYVEPVGVERKGGSARKVLSRGTIAIQGHDPASKVYYKDILIKVL